MQTLKRLYYTLLSWLLPERLALRLFKRRFEDLRRAVEGKLVDRFVEILLGAMELSFFLMRGFRRNLSGFAGSYLLRTSDGRVAAGAHFAAGRMRVDHEDFPDYSVAITFKDAPALRRFLLSRDQDILASILANDVTVDGNLNYVYKLGFLARDLFHRLGVG